MIDQYKNFTDPFLEGDKKAKLLADATIPDLSATVLPKITSHVKTETEVCDSIDDFDYEDIGHLSSKDEDEGHAEEGNTEHDLPNLGIGNDTISNQCVIKFYGETGIAMKFCSTCEVNFTVKVYDKHKQYLHNKGRRNFMEIRTVYIH